MEDTVCGMVSGKDVAVAFSGGLDSGVLAVLCGKYARSVRLYTVGIDGSYDVRESRGLSGMLGMEWYHIPIDESTLLETLREMIRITGTVDPILLSFEVPLMYVLSDVDEDVVITGQGADEVFLGYSKYVDLQEDELMARQSEDLVKLRDVTRVHETAMADHRCKTVLCPYLDPRVLEEVSHIPIGQLRPDGDSRKVPLRHVAESLGHPEIASKPKKAAQYGSGTMNMIRHIAKIRSESVGALLIGLMDGVERE